MDSPLPIQQVDPDERYFQIHPGRFVNEHLQGDSNLGTDQKGKVRLITADAREFQMSSHHQKIRSLGVDNFWVLEADPSEFSHGRGKSSATGDLPRGSVTVSIERMSFLVFAEYEDDAFRSCFPG